MLPIVLGIVCGPLTAALLAFCLLPLFDLAVRSRLSWRGALIITGVIVAGIVMVTLNHFLGPDWGLGPDLTSAGLRPFVLAWLASGIVAFVAYWPAGYLRWVRRWLGPGVQVPLESPLTTPPSDALVSE